MATFVNDLRLTELATGEGSGTWGTTTNTNLELIAEAFSFGTEAITTNADTHTTTIADGSTDPKYISLMLEKSQNENLDLVFGSRYEKGATSFDDDIITRIGNYLFTLLGNLFMKLNISDLLFTYIFAKTTKLNEMNLSQNDYCLCIEIPFKTKILKFKYSTIPCVERKRVADKKKVKAFSDGLKILIYMIKKYLQTINR